MGKGGEIFVFDMEKPVKIVDFANNMIRLSGLEPGIDTKIVFTELHPGEKLLEELLSYLENSLPTHFPKIKIEQFENYHGKSLLSVIKCLKDYIPYRKPK
jgi:FlaA1/EpsC-like NDP-sugar epimerase